MSTATARGDRNLEREAKLDVGDDFVLPSLVGLGHGVRPIELDDLHLEAVYLDTGDLALSRAGTSLRHRDEHSGTDAPRTGWTLKLPDPGPADGDLIVRREITWPGPWGDVPAEALSLVRAVVRDRPLHPVARLVTVRRRVALVDRSGALVAELAVDHVTSPRGMDAPIRFTEVEVELAGDAGLELLDVVVRRLRRAGARPGGHRSKVGRVLAAQHRPEVGLRPEVVTPRLRRRSTVLDVVAASVAGACTRLVGADPQVRLGEDPEAVHQARVATRRLRSDLRTFAPLLDPDWAGALRDDLGRLAEVLGALRDADVLGDRLERRSEVVAGLDAGGVAVLRNRLSDQRDAARSRLLLALDDPAYTALLGRLVDGAASPALADRALARSRGALVLPPLVRKPWRHVARAVDGLGPAPADGDLHQLRIATKRLRYACEAVEVVAGTGARDMGRAAARLQGVLGDHQDSVVAQAWLRAAVSELDPAAAFVAGQYLAAEEDEAAAARAAWPAAWRRLRRPALRTWLA